MDIRLCEVNPHSKCPVDPQGRVWVPAIHNKLFISQIVRKWSAPANQIFSVNYYHMQKDYKFLKNENIKIHLTLKLN